MAENSYQSILRRHSDVLNETRKNVSKRVSISKAVNVIEDEENEKIFLAPNLKMTSIGPCYVPPSYDLTSSELKKIPSQKLSQSRRADYRFLFKESNNDVSVLIIGKKLICEDFQKELEQNFDKVIPNKSLKCYCSSDPTEEEVCEADFYLFLINLDKYYSLSSTQERIKKVFQFVKFLSHKSLIVGISSGHTCDQCVPPEEFQNMLVQFQIPSYKFSHVNRERKSFVLNNIITTIVDRSDSSSARSLISWGLSCPVDRNDTLLS